MRKEVIGFFTTLVVMAVSVIWFYQKPSFEPTITFIPALGTLVCILIPKYWPKKPSYSSRRKKGRITFDYSNNNGRYIIGQNELKFETAWSKASGDSIHTYNDPASIKEVAIVKDLPDIKAISDASKYDFSSRCRTATEGDIVILKNSYGNYAALKIIDIKDDTRADPLDELTFEYVINPEGSADFT